MIYLNQLLKRKMHQCYEAAHEQIVNKIESFSGRYKGLENTKIICTITFIRYCDDSFIENMSRHLRATFGTHSQICVNVEVDINRAIAPVAIVICELWKLWDTNPNATANAKLVDRRTDRIYDDCLGDFSINGLDYLVYCGE